MDFCSSIILFCKTVNPRIIQKSIDIIIKQTKKETKSLQSLSLLLY